MVIDDDPIIREQIESFCSKLDFVDFCLKVDSGLSALSLLSSGEYDLIFLDLNMPEIKGSDLIKHIGQNTNIVIVSSDPSFAVEAFDYNVKAYLVKPFDFSVFFKVMAKLKGKIEAVKDFIFVKDGRSLVKIELEKLLYVKSESNYVRFFSTDSKTLALMKMSDLEDDLPDYFVRVHRSYIVNLHAVRKIKQDRLEVNDSEVPLGASYKDEVLKRLENL